MFVLGNQCEVFPEKQTVVEGSAAIITCSARGEIVWTHNFDAVTKELFYVKNNFIVVVSMTPKKEGIYACYEYQDSKLVALGHSQLQMSSKLQM